MPDELKYISSWISEDLTHCYQLMEAERRELLEEWIGNWKDLVDFEVVPVVTSAEASSRVLVLGKEKIEKGETEEKEHALG